MLLETIFFGRNVDRETRNNTKINESAHDHHHVNEFSFCDPQSDFVDVYAREFPY